MKKTRRSTNRKTGTFLVAESNALSAISAHAETVGADVYGKTGATDYRYHVEISPEELFLMAEKICLPGSPTRERIAMVRSAIETLRILAANS